MRYLEVMDYKVFSDSLEKIKLNNSAKVLSTISPNSYGIASKDPKFKQALRNCDYLVLDGVYFALASILLKGKFLKKNQGPDVFYYFMKKINDINGKIFFLGSSNETLEKMVKRAEIEYNNLSIMTYSPPYKEQFDKTDNNIIFNEINNFKPDIVFIGMTCPKQEKWAYENSRYLKTKLICNIGAVFDWYAGDQKTISPIWWKLNLAWLKRTIDRPEILKRYPNIGIFFYHLFLKFIKVK